MDFSNTRSFSLELGNLCQSLANHEINWIRFVIENSPFIITSLIVIAAAFVSYRSNIKLVQVQSENAANLRKSDHENKISEFRHHWLQELRDVGAEMIRVMHDCQIANMERNMAQYARDKSSENGEDISHLSEELKSKYENLMSNRSEFHELYGKIFLLFKSSDSESRELFKYLDCFREKVGDSTSYSVNYSFMDNVISELQNILKEEWEVTKARSWVKL